MWTFELYRIVTARRMAHALLEVEHSRLCAQVGGSPIRMRQHSYIRSGGSRGGM